MKNKVTRTIYAAVRRNPTGVEYVAARETGPYLDEVKKTAARNSAQFADDPVVRFIAMQAVECVTV